MTIECPHCHTRVIPKPDHSCPACGKNTSDLRGADPRHTRVRLDTGVPLPSFCVRCAVETERRQRIRARIKRAQSGAGDGGGGSIGLVLFSALFGPVLGLLAAGGSRSRAIVSKVRLELPVCELCAAEGRIEPSHIDFELCQLEFVVHRRFAEKLHQHRRNEWR